MLCWKPGGVCDLREFLSDLLGSPELAGSLLLPCCKASREASGWHQGVQKTKNQDRKAHVTFLPRVTLSRRTSRPKFKWAIKKILPKCHALLFDFLFNKICVHHFGYINVIHNDRCPNYSLTLQSVSKYVLYHCPPHGIIEENKSEKRRSRKNPHHLNILQGRTDIIY